MSYCQGCADLQREVEALKARNVELLASLRWAMRHLRGLISFGSSGDAYERATNYELAGFVPKWDKAEAVIARSASLGETQRETRPRRRKW